MNPYTNRVTRIIHYYATLIRDKWWTVRDKDLNPYMATCKFIAFVIAFIILYHIQGNQS